MRQISIMLSCLLSLFFLSTAFADATVTDFTITTTAFLDTGPLPTLYTCDGKNISPEITWTNPPANTKTFAIIAEDLNGPEKPFFHWIVFNIPSATSKLEEGVTQYPSQTLVGKNSMGNERYNGPCPPKGAAHTYVFTLYALDSKLNLPAGSDGKTVLAALNDHIIKKITLTTIYSRWMV
jgi:Raf kinase inhibitor-like YbhB/YbcL family protein